MSLALFGLAAIASALLLLRGAALWRFFAISAGLWGVFAFMARVASSFAIATDARVCVIACCVLNAGLLWGLVASSSEVRWSASRAAIAALLFYVAAIPPMTYTPTDGDESYYILITESLARDHDLDLNNQFRDLAHSVTRRADLKPEIGDTVRPDGVIRSHLEPLLPLLLVPGYLLGGLTGILITMAIFGALLARSTLRLFEEEGISDATARAIFPLFAFGPPVLFYATRVWPEVPAALAFVEAIRGVRARRTARWVTALLALVLLKVRFALVAIVLIARAVRKPKHLAIGAVLIAIPAVIALATTAHRIRELIPGDAAAMLRGLFGLMLDGQQGIAFQAPLYLFGIIAIARWRATPHAFRLGIVASALYIFYLIPRAEWHGGWSPPLRYIVFLMPVLALGCAALWERIDAGAIAVVTAWTAALVIYGLAHPWRLFHIANGESAAGETLSTIWHSDFSRLFPSYIRVNSAAYVAAIALAIALIVFRSGKLASPAIFAALLLAMFTFGLRPGNRIEFEDAHVMHEGGALFPPQYQVQRFLYRGGWQLGAGDSLSFLAKAGDHVLLYDGAGTVQIGEHAYALPGAGPAYGAARVRIEHEGRVDLKCLSGSLNLDRMDHE
jgi:hypothetical protein